MLQLLPSICRKVLYSTAVQRSFSSPLSAVVSGISHTEDRWRWRIFSERTLLGFQKKETKLRISCELSAVSKACIDLDGQSMASCWLALGISQNEIFLKPRFRLLLTNLLCGQVHRVCGMVKLSSRRVHGLEQTFFWVDHWSPPWLSITRVESLKNVKKVIDWERTNNWLRNKQKKTDGFWLTVVSRWNKEQRDRWCSTRNREKIKGGVKKEICWAW